jgi:NAD(P)-dependent dehydrogenase (short-subunit alcohol dehydrogenase family)
MYAKEVNKALRWKEEAAIVTGGSRGIGKGIATMLAERGHRVVVISKSSKCMQVAAELPKMPHGEPHIGLPCDVSNSKSVAAAIDTVRYQIGPVKILVNAAGIVRDALLPSTTDEHLTEVIGTNLLGTIYMVRSLSKNFLRHGSGIIVNIGSIAGLHGNIGQTAYSASKSALVGVTKTWAKELGPKGIRVNLIAPGPISTDIISALSEEQKQKLIERSVLKRLGTVDDVVSAVQFVIENEYVTGQVISVDGGSALD